MMKSFFKKLAFVMALAMVVSLAAPAAQASAAEKKEFTYAYQNGGKVTKLYMNAGETVDLKFVGVPDYKEYELNWVCLDEGDIATVNQKGEITALADGKTNVKLQIKGSDYTSEAIEVVVGEELAPVKLGTSKEDLADLDTVYELTVGEAVDLAFFGVPNYNKTNYTVTWVAYVDVLAEELVEAAAVTVDKNGVVVAVAEGEADVMAVIVNNMTGEALAAEWVNFLVVPAATAEPTPSVPAEEPEVTPEPTLALGVSADETFTEKTLEVEATVDLGFFGIAEENLENYSYTWVSNAPEVATVDQNGVVTAVAPGTAVVTVAVVNNTTGETLTVVPVTFTVPVKAVEITEIKQKNHDTIEITFNQDVAYSQSDVSLKRVFNTTSNSSTNWAVSFFKCEKNVVTLSTYTEFLNGETYLVKFTDLEEEEFNVVLGKVDEIKISFKSMGADGYAYAKLDEDDDDIDVTLSYTLYTNGVDVTNASTYAEREIEFVLAEANDKVEIDDNILVFSDYTAGVALVKPVLTYEFAGEEVNFSGASKEVPASPAPKFGIEEFVAWTIVKNSDEKINWASPRHAFPANDETNDEHRLAVLVKDSYDNYYVYPSDLASKCKDKYNDKVIKKFSDIADVNDDAEYFDIAFKTTNKNKLFVDETDGTLTTIEKGTTEVIVSLYDETDEGDTYLVNVLETPDVVVKEQRSVKDVTATVKFETLPYKVNENGSTKGIVEFLVTDTEGDPFAIDASKLEVKTDYKKDGFTVETATVKQVMKADGVTPEVGKFYCEFYGDDFTYINKSDKKVVIGSVKYTVSVKDTKASDNFTVKVSEPEYDKNGNIEVEEYGISVGNVDQKCDESKNGTILVTGEIKVNELSNKLVVGTANDRIKLLTKGNALLKDNKNVVIPAGNTDVKEGDIFVVIYDKDGVAVEASTATDSALGVYEVEPGVYKINVATTETATSAIATGTSLTVTKYASAGTYTAKVYTVEKVYEAAKDREAKLDVVSKTFDVSNSTPMVKTVKQEKIDLTVDENGSKISKITIEEIIKQAFKFTLSNDKELNENTVVIDKVTYKVNDGSVFIYDVEFFIPLDNDDETVYYKSGKINVKKYVEINELVK